ncbi:MAG: hypothetical protein KAR84_00520 [Elusimicrobiales bacterium]|nr:hypothetical protein [Elusimicrobiales bacterium]
MHALEIIMPIIVLGLAFALKLFIDRTASLPDAISSTLELPVDITFLAISLIVGFTIAPSGETKVGLAWFAFYVLGVIFIVFIWRRSIKCFETNSHKTAFFLGALNYLISITAIVHSIKLVTEVASGTL